MILRRITEHVKAQNWTAVGLDFVIVVVGVFIGIQVANWNEAQSERRQERQILERMHLEVTARELQHTQIASEQFDIRQALYDARLVVLSMVEARPLTGRECGAIVQSFAPLLPETGVAIIDELIATGRLGLITNPEIRRGASALHQLESVRQTQFETYLRTGVSLERRYPELLPYSLAPTDDPDDEDGFAPTFNCDPKAMIGNLPFVNNFAQNVSLYVTAGNVIRANTDVIQTLHESLDEELGIEHGEAEE